MCRSREKSNFRAEKGKRSINQEYSFLDGIASVCADLGISESHFRDLFQSAFGMTPKRCLEAVQIKHAKELLVDRSLTISQISEMVGFDHRYSFPRTFKRLTGYYPSEFREIDPDAPDVSKITCEN